MSIPKEKPSELVLPNKVTLAWLFRNVPMSVWIGLSSTLIAVLVLGVAIGQTSFVKELFNKEFKSSNPQTPLTSDDVKQRIDRLTEGHNNNNNELYKAIAAEEQLAGKSIYSFDRQPHLDAADRLKSLLKQENDIYLEQIKALKELGK